jgi:hypothetical protein
MKELGALIIGILFAIAFAVFTATGKIPVEAFVSVATGAIVWFFKDIETRRLLRELKEVMKR